MAPCGHSRSGSTRSCRQSLRKLRPDLVCWRLLVRQPGNDAAILTPAAVLGWSCNVQSVLFVQLPFKKMQ